MASKGIRCFLLLVALESLVASLASAAVGTSGRVRSSSPMIEHLIDEAFEESKTFRQLVADIEETNGIVYVEAGVCLHGVRSCLSLRVVTAGDFRLLRINVDVSQSPFEAKTTIGHELRHALEVFANPTLTTPQAVYFFYYGTGSTSRSAFETQAAIDAGFAVARDVAESRRYRGK